MKEEENENGCSRHMGLVLGKGGGGGGGEVEVYKVNPPPKKKETTTKTKLGTIKNMKRIGGVKYHLG